MSYLVAASPLTKLFMRDHVAKCEANPEYVFDETPFQILIPRSHGSINLTYMKPVNANSLIKKNPNEEKDPGDYNFHNNRVANLVLWLTGGPNGDQSGETDIYGVVELDLDLENVGPTIAHIAMLGEKDTEKSKKSGKDSYEVLQKTIIDKSKKALTNAKELADMRVRRALKGTYNNLSKQYEAIKVAGGQPYAPSITEAVGAFILAAEIDKAGEHRRKMVQYVMDAQKSGGMF